jgi:hypothetical protein
MRHYKLLVATTLTSFLLAVVAVGALAWITFAPPSWFTRQYATTASVDQASTDASDAESRLDDLETGSGDQASISVEDLSGRLDDAETGGGDGAASSLDDVATTVSNLCDALSNYGGAFGDIYLSAC